MVHGHAPKHESSAHRVNPHAVLAHPGDTAEAVRRQIRRQARTDWELVCVIGDDGRLLGTLTAPELLVLSDDTIVGDVARAEPPLVRSDTDQEKMASIALHHGV